MEYRFSGWSTGSIWGKEAGPPAGAQWVISFKQECKTVEEAQKLEANAKKAAGKMSGGPTCKVQRLHRVVIVDLKYPRNKIEKTFKTFSNNTISDKVEAEYKRKLR